VVCNLARLLGHRVIGQSLVDAEFRPRRAYSEPMATISAELSSLCYFNCRHKGAEFANLKNPHCFPMATLFVCKLANSLIPNASHLSVGSASKIKDSANRCRSGIKQN
jgi:hypothetical protein